MTPVLAEITRRDRQMLRAVQTGHGCIDHGALLIDGLPCCDQIAARRLVDNGLVAALVPGPGQSLARLTDVGTAALAGGVR